MGEWRLFEASTVPEWTTPEWYAGRERAPHVDQAEHRDRLLLAAEMVGDAIHDYGFASLVDLGCGDGGLLSLLAKRHPVLRAHGYDLQDSNVAPAVSERHVDVRYGDVVTGEIEWAEIAVCTEMLEHLIDPHTFVRRVAEHSPVIVASSPFTERPGAAYEFHTWAWDMTGYWALIEQAGYQVVRHQTVGPFQVILGRNPCA